MAGEQDIRSSDNGALVAQASLIRTLRLKVRPSVKSWLNAAAVEVNQCWNWANATSAKAARPFVGRGQWLSRYDLDRLSAGATEYFEHIGADTIQKVNAEFVTRRRRSHKVKLRWRSSRGSKRALGWVPLKSANLRRRGKSLRFCGKSIRVFEAARLKEVKRWRDGCFAQDGVGDWWLCLPVEYEAVPGPAAPREAVGIDLGLKDTATTSDADRLQAGRYYRDLEPQIAQAQRRGHRRQAKRLHRKATRRRSHALHQFSRRIIDQYQFVYIGDVSARKLTQTRMAKSVLDTGWSILKTQLLYKSQAAGRWVAIVDERNTTRVCSSCEALTGPRGLDKLGVRSWECRECGVVHDRDVNAARNILKVGVRSRAYPGSPPSVSGNESRRSKLLPSQTSRRCEARTATKTAAA